MSDLPPDIQESFRRVQAWEQTAKPGDLPPIEIHAHALKVQEHLRSHSSSEQHPRVDAFQKFRQTVRSDDPPQMPPWSAASVTPGLDLPAAERFMAQRRDRPDKPAPQEPWRDPRGSAA